MSNIQAVQSGTGWVSVACLLATGTLLGLSTILAKLAGMHDLGALPFLACAFMGAALILGARAAGQHPRPPSNRRTPAYFVVSALPSRWPQNTPLDALAPSRLAAAAILFLLVGAVSALVGVPVAILLIGEAASAGLLARGALMAIGVFLITRGGPAATPAKKASFAAARNVQRP